MAQSNERIYVLTMTETDYLDVSDMIEQRERKRARSRERYQTMNPISKRPQMCVQSIYDPSINTHNQVQTPSPQ
jgi:hypothetical protein